MAHPRWVVLAAALGLGAVAFVLTRPAADAPAPPRIAAMVEYARTISTDSRGVAGLVFPVRFVEAHCSLDELSVLFVFEAAVPSIRSYAMLALGPADVPDGIDNPSVIAPLTAGEFAAELSRDTWAACA